MSAVENYPAIVNARVRRGHGFRARHATTVKAISAAQLIGGLFRNATEAATGLRVPVAKVEAANLIIHQPDHDRLVEAVLYGGQSLLQVAAEVRQRARKSTPTVLRVASAR